VSTYLSARFGVNLAKSQIQTLVQACVYIASEWIPYLPQTSAEERFSAYYIIRDYILPAYIPKRLGNMYKAYRDMIDALYPFYD